MNILFLDTVHPILEERLLAAGHTTTHAYSETGPTLHALLATAHGLVIRSRLPVNAALLANAPALRFIARAGSGMENIDIPACQSSGIALFNSPEANAPAVAEHATAMLLSMLNHIPRADCEVRSGIRLRAENRGTELRSLTVGIIGYGHTGSAFARCLNGFGCRVLVYDRYLHGIGGGHAIECALTDIQAEAQVLSFHVPQAPDTHHYFNLDFLRSMRHPFYLINTSRGSVCANAAIASGLNSGHLLGACLDVFENETPSFESLQSPDDIWHQILTSPRVILTPHIAGWTHQSHFFLSDVLADKILAHFG